MDVPIRILFIFISALLIITSCENSSKMATEISQKQFDSLQRIIDIQQDSLKLFIKLKDSLFSAQHINDSLDSRSDIDKLSDNKTDESFEGVYGIYDWRVIIKPGKMSYELYDADSKEKVPIIFFYKDKTKDNKMVYEHKKDNSFRYFRFEMQPNHKKGMYYEDDEQWEVVWLEALPF